ncbi:hypothetical protein CRUP_031598, partial [Coryphaenoides rupestris]
MDDQPKSKRKTDSEAMSGPSLLLAHIKFPPELVKKMDPKGTYSENTAGLLRFIRNLLEHYPKDARRINLMSTFPDLLGRVYTFAKKK